MVVEVVVALPAAVVVVVVVVAVLAVAVVMALPVLMENLLGCWQPRPAMPNHH